MPYHRSVRLSVWVVTSLLAMTVSGAEPEDKTGKVFTSFADLAVERNAVLRRYAFLATGEVHETGRENGPWIRPFHAIRIGSKRDRFEYVAFCNIFIGAKRNAAYDSQAWSEKCQSKGRLKLSQGPLNNPSPQYEKPPDGVPSATYLRRKHFEINHIDPFDDPVLGGSHLRSLSDDTAKVEKLFLRDARFLSSHRTLGGNVLSKWHVKWPAFESDIEITHGTGADFFPVKVVYRSSNEGHLDFHSHTRCTWKKHKGHRVLDKMEAAYIVWVKGKPVTQHWYLKFHWLIGDEVTSEFLDFDAEDLREPVRRAFDFEWDRRTDDRFVRAPNWETPEDLFIVPAGNAPSR